MAYKLPNEVVYTCGCEFLSGVMCVKEMDCGRRGGYKDTSGNRDRHLASKIAVKVFTDVSLTISAGNLFQYETAESVLATAGFTPLLLEPKGVAA